MMVLMMNTMTQKKKKEDTKKKEKKKNRLPACLYSRKDLEIRGIYLPYIGFFVVLGLFVGVLKPYHRPAAFITGMAGNSQGTERSSLYDN